jgi:hypothetical protein
VLNAEDKSNVHDTPLGRYLEIWTDDDFQFQTAAVTFRTVCDAPSIAVFCNNPANAVVADVIIIIFSANLVGK